jgi:hypothetical protein
MPTPSPSPCQRRLTVLLPFTALARATTRQGEDGGSLRWSHPDALLLALPLVTLLRHRVPNVTTAPPDIPTPLQSHCSHGSTPMTAMPRPCPRPHWPPPRPATSAYKRHPGSRQRASTTPTNLPDIPFSSPSSRFALELDADELWMRSRSAALDHRSPPFTD